jgi:Na+/phosphate symporter
LTKLKKRKSGLDRIQKRIKLYAFDYFTNLLSEKNDEYLTNMVNAIRGAICTAHPVKKMNRKDKQAYISK